jgi:hypothetical protein
MLCSCGHQRRSHPRWRRGRPCRICGPIGCERFRYRTSLLRGSLLLHFGLAVGVTLVVLGLLMIATGCGSAPQPGAADSSAITLPPTTATLGCAFSTPLGSTGLTVSVTATGPACLAPTLAPWLADHTDRPWASEAVIPGSFGTLAATLTKSGSVAEVWFTGPAQTPAPTPATPGATLAPGPAAALAGQVADELQAAGWRPAG